MTDQEKEKAELKELLGLMLLRAYGFYLYEDELRQILRDEDYIQSELKRTEHLKPGRLDRQEA